MIREKIIVDLVKGKRVLDVGSVGQSDEYCMWDLIVENSSYVKGVDLPESVQVLKEKFEVASTGYSHSKDERIVYGNMELLDLKEVFDVVVAGDVIEHVSNQGLFLDNIKRHLVEKGKLVITTPNAKWLTVMLKPNVTHTLWHDIHTLRTLLGRHGFVIDFWRYYYGNKPNYTFFKKIAAWRQQILVIASPG